MVMYRYTARDSEGRPSAGHIEASSVEDARQQLEAQGLEVLEVMEVGPAAAETAPRERLSGGEAEQFVAHLAQLSAAGAGLPPGLRAAAEESDSRRLALALNYLADELDRGRPLEDVLKSAKGFLPTYLGGLIHAASRTGQLGPALMELVEHYQATSELRSNLWRGLAYPALVACMAAVVFTFITIFIGGNFEDIYGDFGMQLPVVTRFFFWWRATGIWIFLAVFILLAVVLLLTRWRLGRDVWQRWIASSPIVGPLWNWLGLLEWIGLLRVLVRYQITLREALWLAADGVSNCSVGQLSASMAEGIARGRSLSQVCQNQRQIPASLVPLIRLGEQAGALADSLEMGQEVLEDRVRTRTFWLHATLPPLMLIVVGCAVLFVTATLFLPLFSLISGLSG